MPQFSSIKFYFVVVVCGFLLTSCFKDVDFSQSQDIALEPDLEVDLLYYQLNETDFLDSQTGEFTPVIRDTVRLEFLDDDYVQDGLMYAALRFRHENRFPYEIRSDIELIAENKRSQVSFGYRIPAGSQEASSVVDTVYVLEGNEILKIRRSIQMVVELEILGGGKDLEGELDFQSKGLFRFEF